MRAITGARKGTSHEYLYMESNWDTLSDWREKSSLKHFSNITNNKAPNYLVSLLPDKLGENRPNSRQAKNFRPIKTRTEKFKQSYIPSSIRLWNNLELEKQIKMLLNKS